MRKKLGNKKGFTLVGMLISIAIFMSVMAIVYLIFWKSREKMDRHQMQAETSTNARVAIDNLSMDLLQIGFHCDDNTEGYLGDTRLSTTAIIRQPAFIFGDPWQLVFNADLDSYKPVNEQLGPINAFSDFSFPPGVSSAKLYFVSRDEAQRASYASTYRITTGDDSG